MEYETQIAETNANLSEVIFPGVVVCNNNQFRRNFVYWIINELKKDGKLGPDPIIKDGVKRSLNKEEQKVFDLIRGDYFEGSGLSKSVEHERLKKSILNSLFLKDYFLDFLRKMKLKILNETKHGINTTFIFHTDFDDSLSTKGPGTFLVAMVGQCKRTQMIPHIGWKGNLNKSEKNNKIFVDHLQATTSGVCSWIAPLTNPNNEITEEWPKGAISGRKKQWTYDAFGHRII